MNMILHTEPQYRKLKTRITFLLLLLSVAIGISGLASCEHGSIVKNRVHSVCTTPLSNSLCKTIIMSFMDDVPKKRLRILTEKAMEQYKIEIETFHKKAQDHWEIVNCLIEENKDLQSCNELRLKTIKAEIFEAFNKYDEIVINFTRYLEAVHTSESVELLSSVLETHSKKRKWVNDFSDHLNDLLSKKLETTSRYSKASSRASTRLKLNVAKTKAAYAEKAAELERQKIALEEAEKIRAAQALRKKSELDIDIKLLQEREEVALAEDELEFEEDLSEDFNRPNVPVLDSKTKTDNFVNNTVKMKTSLNPEALPFAPQSYSLRTPQMENPSINDFTRFLLKKDILVSRLSVFNEQPENYMSWKSTFTSVTLEIDASPEEEIDLLIKWLGPTSRAHVTSLKAAYSHDRKEGLKKIWDRLDERYGSAESIYQSTLKKLNSFPQLSPKDSVKYYELCDILSEIEGLKLHPQYASTLSYFDSAVGVRLVVAKLPVFIQERWAVEALKFKETYDVPFPTFSVFCNFMRKQCKLRNDPSLSVTTTPSQQNKTKDSKTNKEIKANKTVLSSQVSTDSGLSKCPIHKAQHTLNECRTFMLKPHNEKTKLLRELKVCFKCLTSTEHISKNCPKKVICAKCNKSHATAMHIETSSTPHGGESEKVEMSEKSDKSAISNKCTEICSSVHGAASCAKIVLVDVSLNSNPKCKLRCYAVLDDQSNRSLAMPELFSCLGISAQEQQYTLKSCSGTIVTSGRQTNDCIIEATNKSVSYCIPNLIECADLPSNKLEICTPKQASHFLHLRNLPLQDIDPDAKILLLLGRDVIDAHHVYEQVTGSSGMPFAQRLGLGWVVVGEMCLDAMHSQNVVNVNKTNILANGRPSLFKSCPNKKSVVEHSDEYYSYDPVFIRSPDDNKVSLSVDDRNFLEIMDHSFERNEKGHWIAPLPFRSPRQRLPNNFKQALRRANLFEAALCKNPVKRQHSVDFMSNIFEHGHAEIAPTLKPDEECWFLPLFGVYHPKKPDKIRIVFDSSAQFEGISLNSVLLPGPDLVNSLLGVLMRFRIDQIAFMADIEQMFYSFSVSEKHRNFLRFLWFEDNDPEKQLVQYRMCRHVFGNSPSPAIATLGLHKSVENSDAEVQTFVRRDFYVDDGLASLSSVEQAIDLLNRTQKDLSGYGLRLHKISSNCPELMKAFPDDDLASNLKNLSFDKSQLPQQRSLGVGWNLNSDSFFFTVNTRDRPLTRRGILSTVNSIFDPLGFLAPTTINGKLILREVTSTGIGWDDLVHHDLQQRWRSWLDSLNGLENIQIRRPYLDGQNLRTMTRVELHTFCDASEKAISAVSYIAAFLDNQKHVSFVYGKSKVAPTSGHTIPRLELCAAVLAVQLADEISELLSVEFGDKQYYSDSRVVLGYLNNQSRRFYTYVSNRVQRIIQSCSPDQWNYVPTQLNPADIGCRGITPDKLSQSMWFQGPPFLWKQKVETILTFPLINPDEDSEIRPCISAKVSTVGNCQRPQFCLGSKRFEKFSNFSRLVQAICILRHVATSLRKGESCHGWHLCNMSKSVELKHKVEQFIVRQVQQEMYWDEILCLKEQNPLHRHSTILRLDPYLDVNNILRVGGRLARSNLSDAEKHPVLLPGKHHISRILVHHFHQKVKHQGRLFTEGALRVAGYWIIGAKRLVSSVIHNCVICKKLRGRFESQKMSDLPVDRVEQSPAFSYVGVDVFGPWKIVSRRTRGGLINFKRWAVLFTCLTIRAVHIEVIDEMSSSAFINALKRFTAIRGKVKQYRSDRGSNFVGATDSLKIDAINVEDEKCRKFLYDSGTVWVFNAPHSSHMGGPWERMIGIARRILDWMLSEVRTLTHDVLVTLMAEVGAIINSRPIVAISNDTTDPEILSPSALLTLKLSGEQQPLTDLNLKNLYKNQWQQVKFLADQFWVKWKRDYLRSLQQRRKWTVQQDNIKVGDIVLMKDHEVGRCYWPMGLVQRVFQSNDGQVRKVELVVVKNGKKTTFIRPIVELVKLLGV